MAKDNMSFKPEGTPGRFEQLSDENENLKSKIQDLQRRYRTVSLREDLYKMIFNSSKIPILIFDLSTRSILWANNAAGDFYSTRTDILAKKDFDTVDPELFRQMISHPDMYSGSDFTVVYKRILGSMGATKVEAKINKMKLSGKEIIFIEFLDISKWDETIIAFEEKMIAAKTDLQNELNKKILQIDELKAENKRLGNFPAIIERTPGKLFYSLKVLERNETEFEWTRGDLEKISGYSKDEIDREGGWFTIVSPDDLPDYLNKQTSLLDKKSTVCEYKILSKSGRNVWIRDTMTRELNERGKRLERITGIAEDISELVKYRKQVQSMTRADRKPGAVTGSNLPVSGRINTKQLADILRNMYRIHVYHDKGLVLQVNNAFEMSTNYSRNEVENKSIFEFIDDGSRDTYLKMLNKQPAEPEKLMVKNKNMGRFPYYALNIDVEFEGAVRGLFLMKPAE